MTANIWTWSERKRHLRLILVAVWLVYVGVVALISLQYLRVYFFPFLAVVVGIPAVLQLVWIVYPSYFLPGANQLAVTPQIEAQVSVVEVCRRGGAEVGAVSVRSVIGRVDTVADDTQEIAITLPKSVERISPHEAFTAAEVASLFESFYQRGEFDRPVALGPVEGYLSDGGYVDLSGTETTIVG